MSFIQNNVEALIGIVGILVAILLAREARHKISEIGKRFRQVIQQLWSFRLIRFATMFLLTASSLLMLVFLGVFSIDLFWGFLIILVALMSSVFVFANLYVQEFKQVADQVQALQHQNNMFASAMSIRTELIRSRWPEFMERLSKKLSFIAVESLLKSAELHDFTGDVIVLRIPTVLEPTYNALETRFAELEPILEDVYGKPMRLHIVALPINMKEQIENLPNIPST